MEGSGFYYPTDTAIVPNGRLYVPNRSVDGSDTPTSRSRPTYTPMPYPAGRNRPPMPSRGRCKTEEERVTAPKEIDYAWEKLHVAVSGMLTSEEPLRQRLYRALVDVHILYEPENPRGLPIGLRDEFREFFSSMTSQSPEADEGMLCATVRTLDDVELHEAAERLLYFFVETANHFSNVEHTFETLREESRD